MRAAARAAWRLCRIAAHLMAGWRTIRFLFPGLDAAQREAHVSSWALKLTELMGVSLEVHGTPPVQGPMLLLCNHISWLDIPVIHGARHVRFVSKSAVREWPLIGMLATGAGTLYIERERSRDALRVVHHMTESLRDGELIAVFPEGTTGEGRVLLPFHANLLQAAISADAPVMPLSLHYVDARGGAISEAPRFVGDDTLIASLWRTVRSPPLVAVLRFGEVQFPQGRDRRSWAHQLRAEVQALRDTPRNAP